MYRCHSRQVFCHWVPSVTGAMRRPRPPTSLTSRLLQPAWPVCMLMMVLGQETSAKYICDHHAYVNDDLRRDTTNPDVSI